MTDEESEIVHRELDTDRENPANEVAEIVANLEDTPIEELESTWECIDHVVDHIFSNPPAQDAQVKVTFTYEGYRITVEQNGRTEFVKVT